MPGVTIVFSMRRLVLLLFGCSLIASAEDAKLEAIRGILLPLRTTPTHGPTARGATPAFTTVKHLGFLGRVVIDIKSDILSFRTGVGLEPDPDPRNVSVVHLELAESVLPDLANEGFLRRTGTASRRRR